MAMFIMTVMEVTFECHWGKQKNLKISKTQKKPLVHFHKKNIKAFKQYKFSWKAKKECRFKSIQACHGSDHAKQYPDNVLNIDVSKISKWRYFPINLPLQAKFNLKITAKKLDLTFSNFISTVRKEIMKGIDLSRNGNHKYRS